MKSGLDSNQCAKTAVKCDMCKGIKGGASCVRACPTGAAIRVRPEVSELSSQGAVTLNGFQIPALTIRRAETTIELGSGQSFMIAGLMGNSAQNTVKKMPGAGDIPILGSLFRSTNFQRGETELVIVVTPYLVNPVDASEIKLPTDGYQNPDDIQRIFGNQENNGKSGASRPISCSMACAALMWPCPMDE